jgi:CDGSH-type Zn-finger protein
MKPMDQRKIKVSKNGPYIVKGGIPLSEQTIITDNDGYSHEWRGSKEYPRRENYVLCRCGQSKGKPFCDRTHWKVDFNGTETASQEPYLDRANEIDGPALRLTDAKNLCSIARFCHRAGGIWKLTRESDNPEAKRTAIEEAANCPSGRLVVWDKKTEEAIEPEFDQSIGLVEDPEKGVKGPIWVRGAIPVESADGISYEIRNRVTLCRCGKSSNKPFCDGSHIQK